MTLFQKKYIKNTIHKDKFITYGIESNNVQIKAQNIEYDWQGISFKLIINSTEADSVPDSLVWSTQCVQCLSCSSHCDSQSNSS